MCRSEVVKVRKWLVNASISGFLSNNFGKCWHLPTPIGKSPKWAMSLFEPVVCRSEHARISLFLCQYILRFLISSIKMRKRFYDVLSESVNNKKDNNLYLTSERYNYRLKGVKVAKSVKGKQTVHYRRLKRYDILNIGGEEKLTVPFFFSLFHHTFWFIKFYSHQLMHFFIQPCISLLSYIKIT